MGGTEPATSFGTNVAAYEKGRPDYLDEHVGWMLEGVDGVVLDLAAGSGKLTRSLVRLGFDVVAVDPDKQMLSRNLGVRTLLGRADAIPLPDASVAAVTVGQAWHWFDPLTASAEIARVLTPGGRLGLIWNTRDPGHDFIAPLAAVIGVSAAEMLVSDEGVTDLPGFTPFQRSRSEHVVTMTPAELEALATSRSRYLTSTPDEQERTVIELRDLVATHPHTRGRQRFEYALYSTAYRADLVAQLR
jgi:SAM-dependent methyltransferase